MQSDSAKRVLVRLAAGAALGAALLTVLSPVSFLLYAGRWPGETLDANAVALGAALGVIVALARLRWGLAALVGFLITAVLLAYRHWVYLASPEFPAVARLIGVAALDAAATAALCAALLARWLPAGEPATAPTAKRAAR